MGSKVNKMCSETQGECVVQSRMIRSGEKESEVEDVLCIHPQ